MQHCVMTGLGRKEGMSGRCQFFPVFAVHRVKVLAVLHLVQGLIRVEQAGRRPEPAEMIKDQRYSWAEHEKVFLLCQYPLMQVPGPHIVSGMPDQRHALEIDRRQVDPELIGVESDGWLIMSLQIGPLLPPCDEFRRLRRTSHGQEAEIVQPVIEE